MGVASRNIFDVYVHFYGDVKRDEAPFEERDIRAWVDVPDMAPRLPEADIDPIAPLPSLLATSTLHLNAKAAPYFVNPLYAALRDAAELVDEGEEAARELGSAEELAFYRVFLPSDDIWSLGMTDIPIPRPIPESEGRGPRQTRLSLMQRRRNGDYWGRSRAPSRGGQPYFANSALVLLIQHIARTRDYERAVVPMAAGLSAFITVVDMLEEHADLDEAGWRAMGMDVYKFNEPINEVVLADDPRQELKNLTEESKNFRKESDPDSGS